MQRCLSISGTTLSLEVWFLSQIGDLSASTVTPLPSSSLPNLRPLLLLLLLLLLGIFHTGNPAMKHHFPLQMLINSAQVTFVQVLGFLRADVLKSTLFDLLSLAA